MIPLNPFLRAFFRSTLPSQCLPVQNHILLVPTTEVLLGCRDKETGAAYSDLSSSEDFLASHVLRVPASASSAHPADGATFRDARGKAKQFSTVNGKTVIIKDAFVYSNKGFKTLNQAQLLNDSLFQPDIVESQQWLIYYITRPLVGTLEQTTSVPATLEAARAERLLKAQASGSNEASSSSTAAATLPKKKEVKSFSELLNNFPMIARQMQPGLERLFRELAKEFEKPLPVRPPSSAPRRSRSVSVSSVRSSAANSLHSSLSSMHIPISELVLDDEEDLMRKSLETAITAAIDLFQMVDKQQLSLLGATTDLTGPLVERMIERYIAEQVHDTVIFPRICAIRRHEDLDLESRVRQMTDVDITQVGIPLGDTIQARRELSIRISKGVDIFKRMGVAGSPQEMMDILLSTQKLITSPGAISAIPSIGTGDGHSEKQDSILTINADTLVSLLLVVVIRSPVRHLQARLSYMRHFIFIDDVESGEMGYALSTFEAVLSYLSFDAGGLRRTSQSNKRLWTAARSGDIPELQYLLDPASVHEGGEAPPLDSEIPGYIGGGDKSKATSSVGGTTLNGYEDDDLASQDSAEDDLDLREGLSHVFVFQRAPTPPQSDAMEPPKLKKKKVSMDTRSISSSSAYSFGSRTNTLDISADADMSVEVLARTEGQSGDTVLMMAIDSGQVKSLAYLLGMDALYPVQAVLDDCNNEGTTLLNAAVQGGIYAVIDLLLDYLYNRLDDDHIAQYLSRQDSKGRTAAHYFFNAPALIPRVGHLIPWKLKDKNGQTPLFALCRSYDHEKYHWMVDTALSAATKAQGDGLPLHLDDHVDNKGNTLLHIINDPQIANKLLYQCDSDVNAANDRHFTPFMVASKYGRTDLVRTIFGDPRLDLYVKDLRGLTAVELAKDDDVRNRIDDLVMLAAPPTPDGRTTTVARSFFVEDGTIRLILKSGMPNDNVTVTVITCRRTLEEFEDLARRLKMELPASWIPSMDGFQSPFLIPSRPSRAVLRDIQIRLDNALKILISHPTFSTHELVWEFFLVPDINSAQLEERSRRKAEVRVDMIREEYTPVIDVREVELFVSYARESVRGVHHATRSVLRRVIGVRHSEKDLYISSMLSANAVSFLAFLPSEHTAALTRYAKTLSQAELSPSTIFYYSIHSLLSTSTALLQALNRPTSLINGISIAQKAIDKQTGSLRRTDRWPSTLGLLDEARARSVRDAQAKVEKAQAEKDQLGKELRYTQQIVAGELAGWQEQRVNSFKHGLREYARRMVVTERARLDGMLRAVRGLGINIDPNKKPNRAVPNGSSLPPGMGKAPARDFEADS